MFEIQANYATIKNLIVRDIGHWDFFADTEWSFFKALPKANRIKFWGNQVIQVLMHHW